MRMALDRAEDAGILAVGLAEVAVGGASGSSSEGNRFTLANILGIVH